MQASTPALVKSHQVPPCPVLQSVQVLLNSSTAFWYVRKYIYGSKYVSQPKLIPFSIFFPTENISALLFFFKCPGLFDLDRKMFFQEEKSGVSKKKGV